MIFRSLPFKINAAIIITAITISSIFIAILYPHELQRREEQLKRIHLFLDTVFQQKLNDLANELFAQQKRALEATTQEIQTVESIIGIDIYDEHKKLFLSSNNELQEHYSTQGFDTAGSLPVFETLAKDNLYYGAYSNVIEVIGKKIGYLVIYYDLSQIRSESNRALLIILVLPIVTILTMAALLNLFLFRSIIKPVSILRNAMRKVEKGHLGETVALPGKDEIGDMSGAFNDMSDKLRISHNALIEAESKYRSIFENAIEGIFQYTLTDYRLITVNPSMATILRYESTSELLHVKKHVKDLFFAKRDDWDLFSQQLETKGKVIGLETELVTKEHDTVWVSVSAHRVFDDNGVPVYAEGSLVNITEQKQRLAAEKEREAAESASQAKSHFLAKMSHEIRTPLNAILGFADILESSITNTKQQSYVNIIQSSGANLLTLINDILDLSKIEAGKMDIHLSPVDLRMVIEELVEMFSVTAKQKGLTFSTTFSPGLPNFLMLDGARTRQILFNLIGNAIKFTEKGSVHIQCLANKTDEKNLWDIAISVEDTGPGIPKDALQRIFESFHQQDTKERIFDGTGLGLAITKNLLEMMRGEISVDSELGHGSVFTVSLSRIQQAASTEDNEHYVLSEDDLTQHRFFEDSTILIVDDITVNRDHIKTSLLESPLNLIEAENGKDAVTMALEHKPDLILMDIFMPKADGYEAIHQLRQTHNTTTPIIAITAAGMKEDIEKIRNAGFDEYLIRPFNKKQLVDTIAKFIPSTLSPVQITTSQTRPDSEQNRPEGYPPHQTQWDCITDLADMLEDELQSKWEVISKKQRLPDILLFAQELIKLGNERSHDALVSYGNELETFAENVDIEQLQRSLSYFPEFLLKMNRVEE